jgi:hypothetical protein
MERISSILFKKEFAPYDFQVLNLEGEKYSLCREEILNGELLEDLETESYDNYKYFLKSKSAGILKDLGKTLALEILLNAKSLISFLKWQ